jgi:hypothetical protein
MRGVGHVFLTDTIPTQTQIRLGLQCGIDRWPSLARPTQTAASGVADHVPDLVEQGVVGNETQEPATSRKSRSCLVVYPTGTQGLSAEFGHCLRSHRGMTMVRDCA